MGSVKKLFKTGIRTGLAAVSGGASEAFFSKKGEKYNTKAEAAEADIKDAADETAKQRKRVFLTRGQESGERVEEVFGNKRGRLWEW